MSRRTRKNIKGGEKKISNFLNGVANKSMDNINLLLIIQSNVTGKTYKFLYTNKIGPTDNLETKELSEYPFIKYSPPPGGPYAKIISDKDDYKWPEEMPFWEKLSSELNQKLEQILPKGTLLKIPYKQGKDLYVGLEVTGYELRGIDKLDIKNAYDNIFKGSRFKFIIAPANILKNELSNSFKDTVFIIANVFLKGKEITMKEYEKKMHKKSLI